MLKISLCGKSDAGLKRKNNEDAFSVRADLGIGILADGMGGAAAGELASRMFVQTAMDVLTPPATQLNRDVLDLIPKSYELANQKILQHIEEYPDHKGMGCTAEVLVLFTNRYAVGHVGDSRVYLFRNGMLQQLTRDHSFVQDLMDRGAIAPEEARNHPMRHMIMRAVGTKETLTVDLVTGDVAAGDLFLICSDGLTDMVEDVSIRDILALPLEIEEKADRLIAAAKSEGGKDNITVVLGELLDGPDKGTPANDWSDPEEDAPTLHVLP
jgi:PPM family protein phosphatase